MELEETGNLDHEALVNYHVKTLKDKYTYFPGKDVWKVEGKKKIQTWKEVIRLVQNDDNVDIDEVKPVLGKLKEISMKELENESGAVQRDSKDIIREYLAELPIVCSASDDKQGPVLYYALKNPGENNEIAFIQTKSSYDITKISQALDVALDSWSEDRSIIYGSWKKKVIEAINSQLPPTAPAKDIMTDKKLLPLVVECLKSKALNSAKYIPDNKEIAHTADDPDEYCFKFIDTSKYMDLEETPYWDQFFKRLNSGSKTELAEELFCAWIWSILEPNSANRSALWIEGIGMDGKSSVAKALSEIIGFKYCASINQDSYSNKFFFSHIYGKLLVINGDNKNPRLISNSKVHNLLGRDLVQVEYKGCDPFMSKMSAKLLINANCPPQLSNVIHETSRLIYLRVDPLSPEEAKLGDSNFVENLISEKSAFLAKCRHYYEKYCPNNANFILPPELEDLKDSRCIADDTQLIEDFFEDKIVMKANSKISVVAMKEKISTYAKLLKTKHPTLETRYIITEINNKLSRDFIKERAIEKGRRLYYWMDIDFKGSDTQEVRRPELDRTGVEEVDELEGI